jgi:hypothetical protein
MELVEQRQYENVSHVLFKFRRMQLAVLRWITVTEGQRTLQ